jgi:hypothetical protein
LVGEGAHKRQAVQQLAKKGALLDAEAEKTLDPIAIIACAADEAHAYYLNQDLAVHEALLLLPSSSSPLPPPPTLVPARALTCFLRHGRLSACSWKKFKKP